jgi:hypothetical protein
MDGNRDFRDLLRVFNKEEVRYLIVGAYAVIHYTEPRFTKDLDLWVEPKLENARKVVKALKRFGAPLAGMALEDFTNPKVVFQVGIDPNRIDILMGILGVRFETAWQRRVRASYDDVKVNVLSPEDLLRNKRQVGRPMDEIDAKALRLARQRRRRPGKGRRAGRRP